VAKGGLHANQVVCAWIFSAVFRSAHLWTDFRRHQTVPMRQMQLALKYSF
jgi:hypothetical protein